MYMYANLDRTLCLVS